MNIYINFKFFINMKKIFTTILLFIIGMSVNAQEKLSIGVLPTTNTEGMAYKETVLVSEELTNALIKAKRFNIVDRSKLDALKQERELQKTEDFMDGTIIAQSKSIGANYLLSSTMGNYENDGNTCKFTLTIKLIDVETGSVVASESIQPKSGGFGKALLNAVVNTALLETSGALSTKGQALKKALDKLVPEIDKFIYTNFPITFYIVELQSDDKLLVSGGSESGVKKGSKLKVYEEVITNVGGKSIKRKKELAELAVDKVEDENFSICSIKSGDKEVKERLSKNTPLFVTFK